MDSASRFGATGRNRRGSEQRSKRSSFNPEPAATADLSPQITDLMHRSPRLHRPVRNLSAVAVGSGLTRKQYGSSSQTCITKGGPNPTRWGRARSENLAESPIGPTQPASGSNAWRRRGQARSIQEGSLGPGWCAMLLNLLKHWPSSAWSGSSTIRFARTTDRVLRDLARIQRLTTLTGESPTLFQASSGKLRAYKFMTKRLGLTQRRPRRPYATGSGMAASPKKGTRAKGGTGVGRYTTGDFTGTVSLSQTGPPSGSSGLPGLKRVAKKHSPRRLQRVHLPILRSMGSCWKGAALTRIEAHS